MLALVLAATMITAAGPPTDMTRSILTDVCLPYVTGETSDTVALEFLGFVETPAPEADTRNFTPCSANTSRMGFQVSAKVL